MKIKGIGASSGVSLAKVFEFIEKEIKITKTEADPKEELIKLDKAILETIDQIKKIKLVALKNLGEGEAAIFDAHIQVASDPTMIDEIKELIKSENINAIFATDNISKKYFDMFANMDDAYMKERAADIKDVSKRIINSLAGVSPQDLSTIDEEVVIVAHDLTPSNTAQLNKKFVKGFATNIGGKTSHSAIMARSLEIPAVLGLKNITDKVKTGDFVVIDGDHGDVIINPSSKVIEDFQDKQEQNLKEIKAEAKFKGKLSITKDGHMVELVANIGSVRDVENVIKNDSEGVGLFRSEFLYMDAKDWPTEGEQFDSYSSVLKSMNGKRVIIRTLDIGGDKTLSYFKFPEEMNPFLGYRAIRLSLDKVDIFKTQLRALIRASEFGKLAIMFPMVATINEFKEAKAIYDQVFKEVIKEYPKISTKIEIGVMVEVPSTAIIAKQFAKYVDFLSIGTNDLMQYSMAADRMSEKVSYLYQPLNPSILNLIKMTIDGAHANGKWVGMCGEMAGDTNVIPFLIGLGLDEFSMAATSILKARKQISQIDSKDAKILALNAISAETQEDVQLLLNEFNQ
ncbi:phosphoenolpyruvate--protein phosphotransferase [Candidatus Mycoplasma mahonii]|uniref:phosphoenolpyruvate--protein phosphotransferase n=1 Tax=Candidatus Mycoplasma mahonii TaxID=3004105 RepID=UPI0026F01C00|nr:phosphoenolpyruvate--protein phosphotransferase [Candidatus Mycoplasma mahonii]WKX02518.1 phosphoenolpyruvate--protein phosphotransferase [Candidatus Mycoplasma mahonii]